MSTSPASSPQVEQLKNWFAMSVNDVVAEMQTDAEAGLTAADAAGRLASHGPNVIAAEPSPSMVTVALLQVKDSMNLMLIAVAAVSLFIGLVSTAVFVAWLVVLFVVLGTQQELKGRASVDALSKMQIPQAKVVRGGALVLISATDVVPGDVVTVESGDIVPADGRLIRSATLETQEAALTGESAPISKDPTIIARPEVALGDRTNMLFQNTSVTRGTGAMVVTATGMNTQMGQIATMLSVVAPKKSPLQRELDSLTKVLGVIAWAAVVLIVVLGVARGQSMESVLMLGVAMAISAIPTGLPTFVQTMLAFGAKQLTEHKAVVKNLTDVETLGATSAINSDKTGTLTMNEMTVRSMYVRSRWYTVGGEGYGKIGNIRGAAGDITPDFTLLAYGLCLCSDATVSDEGAVIGDPTEAALVVHAAKIGVDAQESRRAYPRVAEVPFDSAYKFMATFHNAPLAGGQKLLELVKGGPDVVLDRCTQAATPEGPVPIADVQEAILAANREMSEKGLRVLAFAVRDLTGHEAAVTSDAMSFVEELQFVGMVGIIDPLRASAVEAVRVARQAGIEVRMITGDHAITAAAIGADLGLGPGAVSGADLAAMSDAELTAALPDIHVFGRVTPQDKVRLARLMQDRGDIVAMTGDAVNDAAALKQADIGVAMGSGSEVTKQAGKMILTDDNFGTLVTAISLGRSTYEKISNYVRYQMAQLLGLVLLFLTASIANINGGMPLTPLMILFLNFFISVFPVVVIMRDPPNPGLMTRPPRDPEAKLSNPAAIRQWLLFGGVLFLATLAALMFGPGELAANQPSVRMTMAFVVMAFGTIFSGLVLRRDLEPGLAAPLAGAAKTLAIPAGITLVAVEWTFMQKLLLTTPLTTGQWLASLGLALLVPITIELNKIPSRRRLAQQTSVGLDPTQAVTPQRGR